jgi:hypothetical protein
MGPANAANLDGSPSDGNAGTSHCLSRYSDYFDFSIMTQLERVTL